jgi:hypothetical protein
MTLLLALLAACGASPPRPTEPHATDTSTSPADTPSATDTPPADTPSATDTPGTQDTDPVEPVDSDTPDAPVDSAPAPLPPPNLAPGFLDLTAAVWAAHPRVTFAGDLSVRQEPTNTHGIFVDLDGDGATEVVIEGTQGPNAAEPTAFVLRYDPATETLAPDAALAARFQGQDDLIAALIDLDDDGLLDLLPGRWDERLGWGAPQGVFARGPGPGQPPYGQGFMATALFDVDADGWLDMVQTGGCRPDADVWGAWLREGARTYVHHPELVPVGPRSNPYTLGAVPGFGAPDVVFALGNTCDIANPATGTWTSGPRDARGYPTFTAVDLAPADALWRYSPAVAFGPITRVNPMGGMVVDFDSDGALDLLVASAWAYVHVLRRTPTFPWDETSVATNLLMPPRAFPGATPDDRYKPWGVAAVDLDRDGRLDVVSAAGLDASDFFAGRSQIDGPVLHLDRGGVFEEHALAAGLDAPRNARSLTVGDLDRDGAADLILGGNAEAPRVWLNRIPGVEPALAVRLTGVSANRSALGATVQVLDEGRVGPVQLVGGANGPGPLSEPLVFATTGSDAVADVVRVRWPGGWVQDFLGVPAGHVTLAEPPTLDVSPPGRHLPADGASVATLRVTPRGPDGAPRAAHVEVIVTHGEATVLGVAPDGDGWVATLLAPTTPGSCRVEVWVDGAAWPLAPRLWFDPTP